VIGSLRGKVIESGEETLILEVGGVGYELTCSLNTLTDVIGHAGETHLTVHTQLREDALTLFGFSRPLEKKMFLSLLKVNGVGPKSAIKILSGAPTDQLAQMIEAGDVKGLSGLPKVAKKTAEQIILTLKGKLVMEPEPAKPKKGSASLSLEPKFSGARADILSALVNLGFRLPDAEKVVGDMDDAIDVQQGVRQGLQALTGSF
jgi:Holliday junction DNA helicase RuvA